MDNNWLKFTELHGGNSLSRDSFEELCTEILDIHYPGKDIVENNDFETFKSRKLTVVFLTKFFFDSLNSSRKGQIRNAFNSFIKNKSKKKQRVYEWVVCIPYVLSDDEMKWWLSWKNKATLKYSINIQIFDGDFILQLAKKYFLFDRWFKNTPTKEISIDKKEEIKPLELIENKTDEEKVLEIIPLNNDEKVVELLDKDKHHEKTKNHTEETDNKKYTEHIEEENNEHHKKDNHHKEKNDDDDNENKHHKDESDDLQEKEDKHHEEKEISKDNKKDENDDDKFSFAEKITSKYSIYLKEFKRLKTVADNLSDEQKKELKNLISDKEWDKKFQATEIDNLTTLNLFYKAKSNEVHKNYPTAVFLYEEIIAKPDFKKVLKFKIKEIKKSLEKCKKYTEAFLNELEGDIYYSRNNIAKAVTFYETAYKLNKNNKIVTIKYFELLADNQVENDTPEAAIPNYEKAKNLNNTKELQLKLKNAKYLATGNGYFKEIFLKPLNIFISPFAYMAAHSTIKNKKTKKKLKQSLKKFYIVISLIAILAIFIVFAVKKHNIPKTTIKNVPQTNIIATSDFLQPVSPAQIAYNEGVNLLDSISLDKIHLIDTAMSAFKRSLTYSSNNVKVTNKIISFGGKFGTKLDTLSYSKFNEAKKFKQDYIANAQANILRDSASYFISMRHYSDGLKLFKYIFNPANSKEGKYGYVDTLMNIVVPPVYDFDYKHMYKGNESFNNEIAFVCLVNSLGDTTYFYIDKNSKKIK